jgi:hypothetical protein
MTSRQASGVAISFVNTGNVVLHHVTFDVAYHTIDADISREVRDTGVFGPGARIDHHFDEFEGVTFLGTATNSCVVTHAE